MLADAEEVAARPRTRPRPLRHTLTALNRDLQVFAEYYNTRRPHRVLNGRTPAAAFAATGEARPAERPCRPPCRSTAPHASTGGTVVGPYAVSIDARFGQLAVTAIREG